MVYQNHSVELSNQLESFIHKSSCKCEICKTPHLKFVMFQIGCHYSRLMWMINKPEASVKFNAFALEPWRNVCDKMRRAKDCDFLTINKINFVVFSIRWLFQVADAMIKLKTYEEVEEVYQEIDLICTSNIPDHNCFKKALHTRKESLSFLLEHGLIDEEKTESKRELTFEGFLKARQQSKKSPSLLSVLKRPVPFFAQAPSKKVDVIYVDLCDDDEAIELLKVPKTAKKRSGAKSSNTEQTPNPSRKISKPEETPKSSARKAKVDAELTSGASSSSTVQLRKTKRRMI